jgi:isopenicillin N synthase-like dioxygenase
MGAISHIPLSISKRFASRPFINAPHADINLITLLPAATQGGLEIQDRSGNWARIEPNARNILVFCGAMLAQSSAGFYRSTMHRVAVDDVSYKAIARVSLSFFVIPRDEVLLSPAQTARQYLAQRLKEATFGVQV